MFTELNISPVKRAWVEGSQFGRVVVASSLILPSIYDMSSNKVSVLRTSASVFFWAMTLRNGKRFHSFYFVSKNPLFNFAIITFSVSNLRLEMSPNR
jgi:hypothetical protein